MEAVEKVQKLLPEGSIVQTEDVLELIKTFASTWFSLESYDENKLPGKGTTKKEVSIQADDLYNDVENLKKELIKQKQATEIFAQEKNPRSLEGILGNVLQSAFGDDMYPSVEGKAAHLLYFIVKNHPFTDGNKRTGAFAFVWFLSKTNIDFKNKITPQALTTITLLVAESNPKDKDRIIGLILLLLGEK
jgi:prophage maintenance system killer protein